MIKAILVVILLTLSLPSLADGQVFLFRHAEKQKDGTRDPALTQTGHQRAQWLAQFLKDKNIKRIFSSDYKRTRQTVEPLAKKLGITLELYHPKKPQLLLNKLSQDKQNVVVVGHSNTIPDTVAVLGGKPGKDIAETEYDRLYLLTIKNGKVTTKIMRSQISN